MKRLVLILAAASVAAAYGNTGAVSATLEGGAFNVSFANHAHETNSLWVVYGSFDYGLGTNGWAHVERLGTVTPETNTWTYAAPDGWGESVKAIRFILSEVPYDYDYTLGFLRSGKEGTNTGGHRICLDDFTMRGSYCVCLKMREFTHNGNNNLALFSTRAGVGDVAPKFTLFWIGGTNWRWDYGSANGTKVSGAGPNVFYELSVSGKNGVVNLANNTVIATKSSNSALTDEELPGRLEFFCANQSAGSMSNSHGQMELYWARVYDSPEAGAALLVNLVPMVKDGRAGMYDTVRDKFYYSDTSMGDFDLSNGHTRVESANPFFADALVKVAATGPELFTPASAVTVSTSITNAYGGILNGTATLTLTGENDWGGSFIISNGTLVAAFGQGLAATDCLRMRPLSSVSTGVYGGYGGWNGRATESLGSGAGQLFTPSGCYYAWCAADGGELEVDIGGAGEPWTTTSERRRLLLNGAAGAGTLHFANPITLAESVFILRSGQFGTVFFDQSITNAADGTVGHSMRIYGVFDNASELPDGRCVFRGANLHCLNLEQYGGNYVMDEGTTNTIDATFKLDAGAAMTFLATNATVKLTGADGEGGWLAVYGGKATFAGGTLEAGGFRVGQSADQAATARRPALTFNGKVRLAGIGSKSFGSGYIEQSAASEALTIEDGADVEMYNLTLHQRQILHKGGKLTLKGGYGILEMAGARKASGEPTGGTGRYALYPGAELVTPGVGQDMQTAGAVNEGTAEFVFRGGTVGTRSSRYDAFFRDFNSKSHVYIASNYGGEFRADHATAITNKMETAPNGLVSGSGSWNHAAEDWLTAPAFKKSGAATLTLA
ncbi:MAG: hypothetical protein IJ658_02235, partial [Kiritimatiellae bacterium]|nr:hypothetical protein [Kiritimatiellia bacterium]